MQTESMNRRTALGRMAVTGMAVAGAAAATSASAAALRPQGRSSRSPCCWMSRSARSGRRSTASSPSTSAASSTTASGSVPIRRSPTSAASARRWSSMSASSGRSSFAGREAASPTGTTGATASARARAGPAGSAAGARRPRPTSSAPTSSSGSAGSAGSSLISPPTSAPARPRSFSSGSNTATRRPARPRWPTSARPTASASRFGVRYWGVGNESWGCGGKFTPEDYCREYRRFTDWLPQYGVPLYLIAAGPNGNNRDWTRRFFAKWADGQKAPIHGWAPHYYCGTTGHALEFTDRPVVRAAPQGQPDGDADPGPVERSRRVRSRSTPSSW